MSAFSRPDASRARRRVLLLNPPGQRVYIRDYFCSKTTKSNYLFHPIDLVVLSGTLASRHDVQVLDAIAERLDERHALERLRAFAPEIVIALVGSVSWDEDRAFLAQVAASGARVLAIGDVLQEDAGARLSAEPWLEAVLHDFTSDDVLRHLDGERGLASISIPGAPCAAPASRRRGDFRVPTPRHELFPHRRYSFSFARRAPFATVLTDYGCPYPCTFCVIGTLAHRARPVEDVLAEIDHVRALGLREIFFLDQTFGLSRTRALELCAGFEQRGDLSWTAFTRPDTVDDERLSAYRRAGCHTLILGVESADDAQLARYRKGYTTDQVREGVARVRAHGLRTVGTFIVGLPEETEESLERTLAFARELELDYLSLNMAVPRFSTPFRGEALASGLTNRDELVMDQGGEQAFLETRSLDRERMLALKKSLVRRFYLRPSYLWKRLRGVRTWHELSSHVREGVALLARNV